MERLTCNELKIYDGCFVNMAKREESRKYSLLIESAPTYEEIYKKLTEYENLEEQGLLLRLPYPLGTEDLYFADNDDWYVLDARKIQAQKMPDGKILYEIDNFEFWEEDFGKIVFLTQEEAELELTNKLQSHAEAIMDERNGR